MLQSLKLTNFRSHQNLELKFSRHTTALVGPNGVGKTNVVEAIYALIYGHTFRRNASDREMIRTNKDWSRIETIWDDTTYGLTLDGRGRVLTRKRTIEGYPKSFGITELPVVLFEPDQLRMFHGSPETRREWIDNLLISTNEHYKTTIKQYQRVLRQRNTLLKNHHTSKDMLFVFNLKLSEYGAIIDSLRRQLIAVANKSLTRHYNAVAGGKDKLKLLYVSGLKGGNNYSAQLLKQLLASQEKDLLVGFTTVGPHRDDITALLNSKATAGRASRGETRTIAFACKLVELAMLEQATGKKPLLLLDDVLSELDEKRQRNLIAELEGIQTIICATNAEKGLGKTLRL